MRARAALAPLLLAGCMPLQGYGSARTLRAGAIEHQIALDLTAIGTTPGAAPYQGHGGIQPVPRYAFRYGLGDRLELGVTGYVVGGGADLKIGLVQRPALAVSVAPGANASGLRDGGSIVQGRLPLLVEVPVASWLALRPTGLAIWGRRLDDDRSALLVGGSLGLAVTPARGVTLEPSLAMLVDPDVAVNYYGAGLGLQIGGDR